MTSLITMGSSDQLLEIFHDRILHIQICEDHQQAKVRMQKNMEFNKDVVSLAEIDDNIVKIEINNISLFSFQNQLALVKMIKELLQLMDSMAQIGKLNNITEGFFYFNNNCRKIQFYRISPLVVENCSIPVLETFSIYTYLLYTSTTLKDYINKWNQTAFKKYKVKPDIQIKSKLDNFFADIFKNEITSIKMAIHSLQILQQKISGPQDTNKLQLSSEVKQKSGNNNYENMKINLSKQTPPRRLRQSNSMTNLSSCSKNRKYKKQSPLKNADKLLRESKQNNNSKGWEKLNSFGDTINSKMCGSLLKSTNVSSMQRYQREDSLMQSFSKINRFDMERMTVDQSNLYELLQKKEQIRKNSAIIQYKKELQCSAECPVSKVNSAIATKKSLLICEKAVNVKIQPIKRQLKMRMSSSIYSINELMINPKPERAYYPEQTLRMSDKKLPQSKFNERAQSSCLAQIKNETTKQKSQKKIVQENRTTVVTPFTTNSTFLRQTIQILCIEKALRKFWLISLFAMYTYYFTCLFTDRTNTKQETSHRNNLTAICSRIQQLKTSPEFSKQLDNKIMPELEYLLNLFKGSQQGDKAKITQASIVVLVKQFEKNKGEILRQKNQLIKMSRFKTFLLYLVRLALCISVIKDIRSENCGVDDFIRYQLLILDQKKTDIEIDLLSQIRNCQMLI